MLADGWPDAWQVSAHRPADVARVREGITTFFQGPREEAWVELRHEQGAVRALLPALAAYLVGDRKTPARAKA